MARHPGSDQGSLECALVAMCRYVERNPLRARLVRRAENWRWGSLCAARARRRDEPGVRVWDWLRRQPHWRDVIVIGSDATPDHVRAEWRRRGLRQIIVGHEKVDLARAIDQLGSEFGAARIRIESGGTLNGLLLEQNLVDEVAMLVHPVAVGGRARRTLLCGQEDAYHDQCWSLKLESAKTLDGGLLHLRYVVDRASSASRDTPAS